MPVCPKAPGRVCDGDQQLRCIDEGVIDCGSGSESKNVVHSVAQMGLLKVYRSRTIGAGKQAENELFWAINNNSFEVSGMVDSSPEAEENERLLLEEIEKAKKILKERLCKEV